ncbi:hypothetical protein PMZ80_010092 [Knufia obscura]|uniref:Uncharacterized protein n=1 Tax=Knufia obscura TaxID=1635080 RepID=A0ABR0RB84_9EURO|nr:hypothetical protein PMZ80_010092 [Knufia obscura]
MSTTQTTNQTTTQGTTVVVTALGPNDTRRCAFEGMTQAQIDAQDYSHEVTIVGRLPNGRQMTCSQKVPANKVAGMAVAVEDAILAAGIHDLTTIGTILIDVQNINALSRLIGAIIEASATYDRQGRLQLLGIGRINEMPFYTYWRIAQLAQELGMRSFLEEMLGRIKGMFYKEDKKRYRVDNGDINLIYKNIPDDQNHGSYWIRYHISKSIALASLDGVLHRHAAVQAFINDRYPEVGRQIGEIHEHYRQERIQAERRARRGY